MNKVVPTILTMSALLVASGCSNTDSRHSSHSGVKATHASYVAQAQSNCTACGGGQYPAAHAHGNQASNGAAVRHSHSGAAGHTHNGYTAGYGYTVDAGVSAGRNIVRTGVSTAPAVASSGGGGSSALVKIAGALLVGGLIYNATKDDDDDNNSGGDNGDGAVCGTPGKKPC